MAPFPHYPVSNRHLHHGQPRPLTAPPLARDVDHDPTTGYCRCALDRSLLRLSPRELDFFKTETNAESEHILIHQVASDAYHVLRLLQ